MKGGLVECMALVNKSSVQKKKTLTHIINFVYEMKAHKKNTDMTPKDYSIELSKCLFFVQSPEHQTMDNIKPTETQITFLTVVFSKGESK